MTLNMDDLLELRARLLSKLDKPAFMYTKSANCLIVISDRMTTVAGRARSHGTYRIKLNRRLLEENPSQIEQVFAHELAHLVAAELYGRKQGHGPLWARIMLIFGYQPRRCHSMDTSELKVKHRIFAVYCDCRTHMVKTGRYNKMRRGAQYTCKLCKSNVRFNK